MRPPSKYAESRTHVGLAATKRSIALKQTKRRVKKSKNLFPVNRFTPCTGCKLL